MFDVVVLAGTGKKTPLTEQEGVDNKAFIEINGRTLLSFTLEALRAVKIIDRIAAVGPVDQLSALIEQYNLLVVSEKGEITDNIQAAVSALRPRKHFLIVAGDIPLLTARAAEDFLEQCAPYEADFYYPIVSKEENEKRFPGIERTYARLKDGVFTGGNLFLVNPHKVDEWLPRLNRFIELRKSPFRLANALGFGFVLKFIRKTLTIAELERNVPRLLGISGKAVICGYPEIGTDVDKISDLELVRRELSLP
ncbi:MAG: nucleotidyltransferase family protein [Dethiobacter sp.]|jgi:molybdopterin-guanine dinucleotide biosynthesis protein A|nr:nucleotidyltransferase family protein [Dethiobacter sp.]MBS4023913.1 nucleotidyltransferase family protein [Dethiobacter sp.]